MPSPLPGNRPNQRFRASVRWFYAWIGSMVLLGAAPIAANALIHRDTLSSRIAGVIVGVAGVLPWMWAIASLVRKNDEYGRRIHLVALGSAFVATLVLILTLAMLVRAEFIGPPDLMVVWAGLLVIWVVAMLAAKQYFERGA